MGRPLRPYTWVEVGVRVRLLDDTYAHLGTTGTTVQDHFVRETIHYEPRLDRWERVVRIDHPEHPHWRLFAAVRMDRLEVL